ncbi:MAG: hypothetical protein GF418_17225 [Chitinivibrionales bacterium]|nr:hypothetical protein [Chitinivibrionales bacterium]MBD3397362.1 hypothetical protein [Chitinivibrionales bacterium]
MIRIAGTRSAAAVAVLFIVIVAVAASQDTLASPDTALFIYDKIDDNSRFYIEAVRENLGGMGIPFKEAAAETEKNYDASPYHRVIVYSMVMGFNMISPVRSWLRKGEGLTGKDVLILVTANRWFNEKQRKELVKIAGDRQANVIDAVSMATEKLSDEKKQKTIGKHLARLQP